MGRLAVGLALAGLVCSTVAVVGGLLAILPFTPGRLAYYALVSAGSTPRLAVAAGLGCVLAVPATLGFTPPRRVTFVALLTGAFGVVLNSAVVWATLSAVRSRNLSVSLRGSLLGATCRSPLAPERVTFSSAGGWPLAADLYRPSGARAAGKRLPSVIVVHGGAWQSGDKGENPASNQWLVARGYLVLDIQYRLAPAADWRGAVEDIRRAAAWLRGHAAETGADPDQIAFLGRSAGGHLALLAAYATEAAGGPEQAQPWCVIALYAPADLRRLHAEACRTQAHDIREGISAVIGSPPSAGIEAYRLASPLERVHPKAPPTLLIHGDWDTVVQAEHSRRLARALRGVGVRVQLVCVPFARHAFDLVPDGLGTQVAREAVAAFLASESLKAPSGSL
ncbi:MAG: alpha/beta hydrolase [Chloroflexota bacterium]